MTNIKTFLCFEEWIRTLTKGKETDLKENVFKVKEIEVFQIIYERLEEQQKKVIQMKILKIIYKQKNLKE